MKESNNEWMKTLRMAVIWGCSSILCAVVMFVGIFYYFTGVPFGFVKFFQTLHIVETQYEGAIDKPVLLDGALEGIVAKLNDKHSLYLDGDKFSMYTDMTTASYGGIGVYLGSQDDHAIVYDVIGGESADQAGIRRGDILKEVDGKSVNDVSLADIAKLIRGKAGTSVSLTLTRNDEDYTVSVERKQIQLQTVRGEMIPNTDIAYIRIAIFSENTGSEFTEMYRSLKEQGMKRFILDLRNNPGGLLDQALTVSNNFFPSDAVFVSYVSKNGTEKDFTTTGTDEQLPMVLLINENSASASEIVAGDVQDLQLGTVVGEKSYGKGTVQGIFNIDDADAVKVTVAKYKTSNGRVIDGVGIEPDVVIPLKSGDSTDYQFAKAFELLNQ